MKLLIVAPLVPYVHAQISLYGDCSSQFANLMPIKSGPLLVNDEPYWAVLNSNFLSTFTNYTVARSCALDPVLSVNIKSLRGVEVFNSEEDGAIPSPLVEDAKYCFKSLLVEKDFVACTDSRRERTLWIQALKHQVKASLPFKPRFEVLPNLVNRLPLAQHFEAIFPNAPQSICTPGSTQRKCLHGFNTKLEVIADVPAKSSRVGLAAPSWIRSVPVTGSPNQVWDVSSPGADDGLVTICLVSGDGLCLSFEEQSLVTKLEDVGPKRSSNCPGGDSTCFSMPDQAVGQLLPIDPFEPCRVECFNKDGCIAWTYMKPGVDGNFAKCCLKEKGSFNPLRCESNSCCVSEVFGAVHNVTANYKTTSINGNRNHGEAVLKPLEGERGTAEQRWKLIEISSDVGGDNIIIKKVKLNIGSDNKCLTLGYQHTRLDPVTLWLWDCIDGVEDQEFILTGFPVKEPEVLEEDEGEGGAVDEK